MSVAFFNPDRITLCVFNLVVNPEMKSDEQVVFNAVEANAISPPSSQSPIASELSGEVRAKLDVILSLIEPCVHASLRSKAFGVTLHLLYLSRLNSKNSFL